MPPTIAAAYIRVSTADQTEYSPESQLSLIKSYAEKNNMLLPKEYIYRDDGISGRTAEKRPGFMSMISTAKSKPTPFQTILIWKFSRFARNQEESIVYKSLLKKEYGIDVISVSEPLIEGPFGSLIERIIEWMDEYYSIRLSGEVIRGMCERVKKGEFVSVAPFGYQYKEGKLVIDPEKAAIVRSIFNDFMEGMSMAAIAKKYSDMGIKTARGNAWQNRTIRYILTNPVYCGKIRWSPNGANDYHRTQINEGTLFVDGSHEPIISSKAFDEVQTKLKTYLKMFESSGAKRTANQEAGKGGDYMLRGLVKCSACGSSLTRASFGLQCNGYVHTKCRVSHAVSLEKINSLVLSSLRIAAITLNFTVINKTSSLEAANDREIMENQLKKLNAMLNRCKEAYAAGVDTLEEYSQNKARISKEISAINKKMSSLKPVKPINKKAFAENIKKNLKVLEDPEVSEKDKNLLLRSFVDRIIYHKAEKAVEIVFYT